MFTWETGKGLLKDQIDSVADKRAKAEAMGRELQQRVKDYPGVPVHILGFSAGTAIAIFALETVPESVKVDNVMLLGASISHDYDLTEALKRVRGHLYLYTTTRDGMVADVMKITGTADLKRHDAGAEITGFVLPAGASDETRKLYAEKVVPIPWTKELEADGQYGHHFDNIKMPFIRDHVAPLFMGKTVPGLQKSTVD